MTSRKITNKSENENLNSNNRELLHNRNISFKGFKRSDGLYEIEGRVIDTKPFPFDLPNRGGHISSNEAFHDLMVKIIFDLDMVIRDVEVYPSRFPYPACEFGGQSLTALKGLTIGPGWNRKVKEALPSSETCTHLRELLVPLATAAYQSMHSEKPNRANEVDDNGRPVKINSCYAYNEKRELVKNTWPTFYKG